MAPVADLEAMQQQARILVQEVLQHKRLRAVTVVYCELQPSFHCEWELRSPQNLHLRFEWSSSPITTGGRTIFYV